eukprot:scaffold80740_cov27-Tisochrysis_lutea.AAC.2
MALLSIARRERAQYQQASLYTVTCACVHAQGDVTLCPEQSWPCGRPNSQRKSEQIEDGMRSSLHHWTNVYPWSMR